MPGTKTIQISIFILCVIYSVIGFSGQLFKTDSELIEGVPITKENRLTRILYSIGPIDLNKNDLVDIRVQTLLSNECESNVGIGRYLVRTKDSDSVTGKRIIKTAMTNANKYDHHSVLVHTGIELIESNSTNNYYNFILFANSINCKQKSIKVEGYGNDGYGEMIILIR